MINEIIASNELIINSLGWTLLHSIWQILAVASLLAIFLRLNNSSANIRYIVSILSLLIIPFLSLFTFLNYYQNMPLELINYSGSTFTIQNEISLNAATQMEIAKDFTAAVNKYSTLLVILWFSGIALLMIRFAGGLYFVNKLRRSGLIKTNVTVINIVNHFKTSSGIKRKIEIFESVLTKVPLTIGFLKPFILLPAGTIAGIPPVQLEAIIAHEIAHIRRADYIQNLINTIIEILFFYHPGIWWIINRINEERENCCDDIAINLTGNSTGLARALAGLNTTFSHPQHILAMTGKQNQLLERIKRLTGIKANSRRLSYHSYGFIIAALLAVSIAFSVKASVQMPDNFLKTSLSMSTNSDYHNLDLESVPQDTLKSKRKKSESVKEKTKPADPKKENNELSEAEKARLEVEMDKLEVEMKKLEEQMKDLHKQLGLTEWNDFDFKYDFNMDSINIIINNNVKKAIIDSREVVEKAHQNAEVARARAMRSAETARSEARGVNETIIIIDSDGKKIIRGNGEDNEKMKAKRLKIKAESNQLEEELRKDKLIKGEHFNLKIDNTGMYLDDKKQSENVYQKYKKIIMSDFDDEDAKWMEEKKFNINITK